MGFWYIFSSSVHPIEVFGHILDFFGLDTHDIACEYRPEYFLTCGNGFKLMFVCSVLLTDVEHAGFLRYSSLRQ